MNSFDNFTEILSARQSPPLFPTEIYDRELSKQIAASELSDELRCGFLLWNDDLHASHDLSQNMASSTGSFWHAIMHRREGDASNSQYWWRRVGTHPAFVPLHDAACKYLHTQANRDAQNFAAKLQQSGVWNPVDFVLACDRADEDDTWLRELQVIEMQTVLNWCRDNS